MHGRLSRPNILHIVHLQASYLEFSSLFFSPYHSSFSPCRELSLFTSENSLLVMSLHTSPPKSTMYACVRGCEKFIIVCPTHISDIETAKVYIASISDFDLENIFN
jgi:hypothetical protein